MFAIQEFSEMASHGEEFGTIKASQFITVQMMTGEQLEVEIEQRMTYEQLYVAIHAQLPEEIRPDFLSQMNLLLHGELVPCCDDRVVPHSDVYYLLLDPALHLVEFDRAPCDVWDHGTQSAMECFRVIIREEETKEETCLGTFVYHPRQRYYLPLEDVEHEWVQNRHGDEELVLWMRPNQPCMDSIGMVEHLMGLADSRLELFLSAREYMRTDMEDELTTFEEKNDVDNSWHACR